METMKNKLIDYKTGEETLCDKVTIDGYDYYVSDAPIKESRYHLNKHTNKIEKTSKNAEINWESNMFYNNGNTFLRDNYKKVICCNNPNIDDVPKVVNEVEILAYEHDVETFLSSDFDYDSFKAGYNKSQETHPFSEEDMIEFVDFVEKSMYDNEGYTQFKANKELLQLWKEQQPKTLYYE